MGRDVLRTSESDLAARHGVAQLGLVVDEGHDAQVGLDEQRLLQDQHAVGAAGNGLFLVGFLHGLHQLGAEVVQLEESTRAEPSDVGPDLQRHLAASSSNQANVQLDFFKQSSNRGIYGMGANVERLGSGGRQYSRG